MWGSSKEKKKQSRETLVRSEGKETEHGNVRKRGELKKQSREMWSRKEREKNKMWW
jgi:hypothetical protein